LLFALGQAREGLEAEIEILLALPARLWPEGAEQEVFLDREARKESSSFRHQRNAEIDMASGRMPTRLCFVPSISATIRPDVGRQIPMMHLISVLLPLPLVPSSTTVEPELTVIVTSSMTRTAP
jgi:hypothetical protein